MAVTKYKLADGSIRWKADFWYRDWMGQRKRKKKEGFLKRSAATQYERDFLLKNSRSCDMSFEAFVELYREDAEHRVAEGTQDTQGNIIDKWLLPYFEKIPINKIDPLTIRQWQNELSVKINPKTGRHYAPTYLRSINSRLSAIFNYAVMYYGLEKNPCRPAGFMGKKKAGKMMFYTLSEFNAVIPQVTNWAFRVAFYILYWTGLRVGECLDLRPADIHPGYIRVEKTHHRKKGRDKSGPPKTGNSYDDVTIPPFLYNIIMEYVRALYDIDDNERIFYFTHGTLNRELDRAADAAGVKRIRIHDLRHSHAALVVELGYSITALAKRLRDSVQVTMDTYSHLYPQKMEALSQDLEILGGNRNSDVVDITPHIERRDLSNLALQLEEAQSTRQINKSTL